VTARVSGCLLVALSAGAAVLLASPGRASCHREEHTLPVTRGEVALTDAPFCPFFVVATSRGFSLLTLRKGREVFAEGDSVVGPLNSPGLQFVTLPDWQDDILQVEVEEVGVSLARAQTAFQAHCAEPDAAMQGLAPPHGSGTSFAIRISNHGANRRD
jgi:hypothetical protein